MKPSEILIAARKKIEKPENWLNRAPTIPETRKGLNCADTAIVPLGTLLVPDNAYEIAERYFGLAVDIPADVICGEYIGEWNDTHTHAEVLAAFDKAIELAKAEE